jgi:hypothetical protein
MELRQKNNTALMQALPDDIEQNHFIVPAYYNNQYHFFTLLSLLALNHQHQNIVIFLSGITSNKITDKATMEALFTHSFVSKLNVITVDDDQSIKHSEMDFDSVSSASPEHERTITIISGAYLNDAAYDALYALAPMAGVSGDNTLEKCVSMNTLPLYWSTNEYSKVPTLRALRNITQSASLNITDVARQSFNTFFDAALYCQYHEKMLDCLYHDGAQPFGHPYMQVDILAMIEAWPTVTAHLRAHHNFYTAFDDIVLEHLPPESISEHARAHIRDQHTLYGALETLGEKIISIYEEMLTHLTEADLDDPATQTMQTFLKTLIKSIKQIIVDPVHLAERCNTFNATVDKLLHHDMRFVALQSHDDYSEVFTCIQNLMTDFATFAVRETETPHCFSFFQSKINLKPSIEALEEAVMTLPGHEKPSFK